MSIAVRIKINISGDEAKIIGICHPNWRGIRSATYGLVSDIFEVPEINSQSEADYVAEKIIEYKPEKIILSGYPSGYDLLARSIKNRNSFIRIFFVSHAPFTWYTDRFEELSWLEKMFKACEEGYIEKVGFLKKDASVFFKDKGINAFFLMNRLPKFTESLHSLNKESPQIGIWGSHMWHRNLLNQAVGAHMVEGAKLHFNEFPEYFFLDNARISRHGVLPSDQYAKIIKSMDVNLYISFTDCFPMTVVQSMSYGIPCIVSDTSEIYRWNDYLSSVLIESKIDSPLAMRDRIHMVFDNYSKIQEEFVAHLPILEEKIENSIAEFLK